MEFNNIIERNIEIGDIPTIVLTPKGDFKLYPTIIFYHGWSSNKELQRFRGFILSSIGYQVIIPDAVYHGERNPLSNYGHTNAVKYFWNIVLKNIKESNDVINYSIKNLKADPNRIGVAGHSMGGFTTAGVFAKNEQIKASVVFNGSFNWRNSNMIFKESLKDFEESNNDLEELIDSLDPSQNLNALIDRPILLLHGRDDLVVNINPQREFYEKILPLYNDKTKIKFIEYYYLGHFVTTNMMEEACNWFNKYLY